MNIEDIKKVLAESPEEATHWDGDYYKSKFVSEAFSDWRQWLDGEWLEPPIDIIGSNIQSLSDLRKIIELTERAEKSERERDGALSRLARLYNEFYACARCGYGFDCKDFDIFTIDRDASALNKFALQQKIDALEKLMHCERDFEIESRIIEIACKKEIQELHAQLEDE